MKAYQKPEIDTVKFTTVEAVASSVGAEGGVEESGDVELEG